MDNNTNTNNCNITTVAPAPFTKGSGKKIAAAYTDPNGLWVTHFIESQWGGWNMVAYSTGPNGNSINVTVAVWENGSFKTASILDAEAGEKREHLFETVSDVIYAASRPAQYRAEAARIAAEAARKQARDERAAVAEAEYAAMKDTDADEQRWERRSLVRIAEQEVSLTIDTRYSVSSQMSDAVTIIQKQYEVLLAKRILAVEGRYNELTDRAWTLTEAVTQVIMRAVTSSDACSYDTAVPHAKAVQRIANRWF